MAKYLSKTITEDNGNQSTAFIAVELKANLLTGVAHVKEGGWKTAQKISDQTPQSMSEPILWTEPDISVLVTSMQYPIGTSVYDILFDVIGARMVTLDNLPDGSGPNPFKGGTFNDLPAPSV